MKTKIFIFFILISIILAVFLNSFLKPSKKDFEYEMAVSAINASDLLAAYILNEKLSDALYAGKIIEVTGVIKEITTINNRITLIFNSDLKNFGVICDVNSNQKEKIKKLKKNQKIRVKGICKGFLKDVILLNCFIDLPANE